jgi:hypothetical protein
MGITLDSQGNLFFDDKNVKSATGGGDAYEIVGAATAPATGHPTLYNNSFESAENAGFGPTYMAVAPGTPEPGSLAMSGVVALAGLVGAGWKRRRDKLQAQAELETEPAAEPPASE